MTRRISRLPPPAHVADPRQTRIRRTAAEDVDALPDLLANAASGVFCFQDHVHECSATATRPRAPPRKPSCGCVERCRGTVPRQAFGTWVLRLAVTAAGDQRRRVASDKSAPLSLASLEAVRGQRPEAAELLASLAALSPALRAPLVLRKVYGYGYAEIAALLGKPTGTVKAAVRRGRAAVIEELQRRRAPEGEGA